MPTGALIACAAALSLCAAVAGAQSAAGDIVPRHERVHPELADSTWKRRSEAAWNEAHAGHWRQAYAMFDSLHNEQPDAVDARMGLGFIARGEQRYGLARRWYRAALRVEPDNTQAREQLAQLRWDRPAEFELMERGDVQNGGAKVSHHASMVLPVAPGLVLNGSFGLFGAGDPLARFFARTGDTTGRGHVEAGGLVWTPSPSYTLDTYFERWAIDQTLAEYAYVDVSGPLGQHVTGHLSLRQTFAGQAPPMLGTSLDLPVGDRHLISVELYHATYSTDIEAQAQARLFELFMPNPRWEARAGVVFDIDPHLAAQTLATTLAYYFTPVFGMRGELTGRFGDGTQGGFAIGLVRRW